MAKFTETFQTSWSDTDNSGYNKGGVAQSVYHYKANIVIAIIIIVRESCQIVAQTLYRSTKVVSSIASGQKFESRCDFAPKHAIC